MRIWIIFFILFLWVSSVFSGPSTEKITIPLNYLPQYGIYTATVKVGTPPSQPIELIVDTGSSSLVFIGSAEICPQCQQGITKGAVNPAILKQGKVQSIFDLTYGSANDKVLEFISPIQYDDKDQHQTQMNVFVLKESNQPASIMGLIHYNLRQNQVKFVPFLLKVTDNFNKYAELTFILCGEGGKSFLHIGPYSFKKPPLLVSQRLPTKFYEIKSSGFYDEKGQVIAKLSDSADSAILDTGTGGFIILNPEIYKPLHSYLFQQAGDDNDKLDKKFWEENYCIIKKDVNFSAFPTLQIGFEDLTSKQTTFLKLPPETYLNQAGCDEGYVRLIFTPGHPPPHPTAIRNAHHRKGTQTTASMIIGTALLNSYAMQIHFKNNPRIEFYDNNEVCKTG